MDKRRRIGGCKPPLPPAAFSPSSARSRPAEAKPAADAGVKEAEMVFNSREDVLALLNEKLKGKNKNDFKGKSEQMFVYIRKLRTCVRWNIEVQDGYIAEIEKLKSTMEDVAREHSETESQLEKKIDVANSAIKKLERDYECLQEKYRKAEEERNEAIESFKNEANARVNLENINSGLKDDLEKAHQKIDRMSSELDGLQLQIKCLKEYNTSLLDNNRDIRTAAKTNEEKVSKLQEEKGAMICSLASLRSQLDASRVAQHDTLRQKEDLKDEVGWLRCELQQVRDDRNQQLAQVQSFSEEISKLRVETGKSSNELDVTLTKAAAFEEMCTSQSVMIKALQHELDIANKKLELANSSVTISSMENEEHKKNVKHLEDSLMVAEVQIREGENLRKRLHNTILELKGNIRVFCRVRPTIESDNNNIEGCAVSYPMSTELCGHGIDLLLNAQKYSFTFDNVFNQEASQDDIFVEISQLVQSALDGYKVCIFAYGQTGSGKTYTMMGNPESPNQKGLIPRSLEQIFQNCQSLLCQGWKYKLQASVLEIYNETIRDLLTNCPGSIEADTTSKHHAIKHDSNGNTHVSDLTVFDVCTFEEVSFLLQQAAHSRSVGRTHMNERSSRSHFIFTLRISGVNENTEQHVQGVLNLIDLAGSERLNKSGSTGDRLKETQAINKSLSALADVIFAIAKKEDHIPFRNSKLTYLLQPCLGGDSKTLMFVNISPEVSSSSESVNSLRFAARVNSCEIGIPRRQTQMQPLSSRSSYG